MTTQLLRACIVGHSFVRRLGEDLYVSEENGRQPPPGIAAMSLEIDNLYHKVHLFGQDNFTVQQMREDIYKVGALRPHCVIINCGSNDLTTRLCDVGKLIDQLVAYAEFLSHGCDVIHVAVLGVLDRSKCRGVSPEDFQKRAFEFNGKLKDAVKHLHGIEYVNMKGFWRDDLGEKVPVKRWSDDGIHPATSIARRKHGIDKYRRIIRRCLLTGAARAHRRR